MILFKTVHILNMSTVKYKRALFHPIRNNILAMVIVSRGGVTIPGGHCSLPDPVAFRYTFNHSEICSM